MIQRIIVAAFVFVFSSFALVSTAPAQQVLVVRGGTLIDGNGGDPLENVTIIMEGERIREIRTTGAGSIPANARVLDATGQFILPGLQDFHVHFRDWMAPLFINEGITTIHDIGNSAPEWILAQREMFQSGIVHGPRLYTSVLDLYGKKGPFEVANFVYFETVEEAQKWTRKAVALKADYLKIHDGYSGEMVVATAQIAKETGIPLVGHVPHVMDAYRAAELGLKHLEHSTGVGKAIANEKDRNEVEKLRTEIQTAIEMKMRRQPFEMRPYEFYSVDPAKQEKLIQLLLEKEVFVEPNWAPDARPYTPRAKDWLLEDVKFLSRPELSFVPKDVRYRLLDGYASWEYFTEDQQAKLRQCYANFRKFVAAFSEAGGKLIVGTTAPEGFPGVSVHREMQLMVDAGITPMKALQAATKNISELSKKQADLGTVEVGKYADLLIVAGDPLKDISNTQRIVNIIKGGQIIERKYSAAWRNPIPSVDRTEVTNHNSPQPHILEVNPLAVPQGNSDITVQISGKGFRKGSVVYFKNIPVNTLLKSPSLLEATIPSELLKVGTYPIQVINPEPLPPLENAGKSEILMFIVKFM